MLSILYIYIYIEVNNFSIFKVQEIFLESRLNFSGDFNYYPLFNQWKCIIIKHHETKANKFKKQKRKRKGKGKGKGKRKLTKRKSKVKGKEKESPEWPT